MMNGNTPLIIRNYYGRIREKDITYQDLIEFLHRMILLRR